MPEFISDFIGLKSNEAHLVDALSLERLHGKVHHAVSHAMLTVIGCHTHMIEKSGPSVMSAQDGSYNAAILLRYHAGGGIAL